MKASRSVRFSGWREELIRLEDHSQCDQRRHERRLIRQCSFLPVGELSGFFAIVNCDGVVLLRGVTGQILNPYGRTVGIPSVDQQRIE